MYLGGAVSPASRHPLEGRLSSYDYDDYADAEESFAKRKDRRKPKGRRSVKTLEQKQDDKTQFEEPGLQHVFEMGLLDTLIGELKSGKEATVYLAEGPQGLLAAKVYSDMAVRSFKNDQVYRDGRFIGDDRLEKAIQQRSRTGLNVQQALWILHEYIQLWELYEAGVPVPKPAVGPGLNECAKAGRVVLMNFIGDDAGVAAPRLSDVRLTPAEGEAAFAQSLDIMVALLKLGKVHGDYSAYNLLWWEGRVIVIDVPQMVNIAENKHAPELLEQDVESLCQSLRRSVDADPQIVLLEVRRRAGLNPALNPLGEVRG